MAKISESRGRQDENSGYTRLFGNSEIGKLLSRVQATVIRQGNELEKALVLAVENDPSAEKLHWEPSPNSPAYLVGERAIVFDCTVVDAMPVNASKTKVKADLVILQANRSILVVELKDGDTFDTKKSSGELESLNKVRGALEALGYHVEIRFCAFNQDNKGSIVKGAKGRFTQDQVLTGRELCQLLGVDFDQFVDSRRKDQRDNLEFFITQLLGIPDIKAIIIAEIDKQHLD